MTSTMTIWDGRAVPRIGMGCWAIGGQAPGSATATSYGAVNDVESRAALRLARELGARVFDTADAYGAGHAETLVGEVFGDDSDIVVVTKFGGRLDPERGLDLTPAGIGALIDNSRRRLKRDRLDLVLFHLNHYAPADAGPIFDALDGLTARGLIAAYGWSTDSVDSVRMYADRDGFRAIENDLNVFTPAVDLMALAAAKKLTAISRLPLAMGLLTGKYDDKRAVGDVDVRRDAPWVIYFADGRATPEFLQKLGAIRELLTTGGRTLAQGALSWILAYAPHALPVPGFKTEAQVAENYGAAEKGPLPASVMAEIERILGR